MLKRKRITSKANNKADSFMTLEERFDQHKLNHIIQNEAQYRPLMRKKYFDNDYKPFTTAAKYLKLSTDGLVKTKYKQNNSYGRFYAVGQLSLQSIPREVRHTIAREFYVDIDIKNAHPVILAFLCKQRGIKCKYLKKYNKDRDERLASLSSDKEQAKGAILSMINGGRKAKHELAFWPPWLNRFSSELKAIHSAFATDAAFKVFKKHNSETKKGYNMEARYMNTLLCDFENNILMVLYKLMGSPSNCVLCFDA